MMDELIALAGDLVFERKRISESLRKLEGTLLHGQVANELYQALGIQSAEELHVELDKLSRSLDRIGALTKTLVHQVNHDRLVACDTLLTQAQTTLETAAARSSRSLMVERRANDVKVDRELLEKFKPVFFEMLETFVEFCVESDKERAARKKRAKAYVQFEMKPVEDGYRLMVVCDGNGIVPPLLHEHGLKLARIGVRASFEGKPGQWSAWLFHLPSNMGAFRCLPVRIDGRNLSIPYFAAGRILQATKGRAWFLDKDLRRHVVDKSAEAARGKVFVEIAAGTHSATFLFDAVAEADEVFMKPLSPRFNGGGRFLGVVVNHDADSHGELSLVMNPGYLVYGESVLGQEESANAV